MVCDTAWRHADEQLYPLPSQLREVSSELRSRWERHRRVGFDEEIVGVPARLSLDTWIPTVLQLYPGNINLCLQNF